MGERQRGRERSERGVKEIIYSRHIHSTHIYSSSILEQTVLESSKVTLNTPCDFAPCDFAAYHYSFSFTPSTTIRSFNVLTL